MIEIYDMNGFVREPSPESITFEDIAEVISFWDSDGEAWKMVEMHTIWEHDRPIQCFCNEDGEMGSRIGVPPLLRNGLAKRRVGEQLLGPCWGHWVFLSGKDKLR